MSAAPTVIAKGSLPGEYRPCPRCRPVVSGRGDDHDAAEPERSTALSSGSNMNELSSEPVSERLATRIPYWSLCWSTQSMPAMMSLV
jgi:hypothetical protein